MSIYLAIVKDIAPTEHYGTRHSVTIINAYSLKNPGLRNGEWNKRVIVPTDNRVNNPWIEAVKQAFVGRTDVAVTENDIVYMGDKDTKRSETYYLVDAV